MKKVIKITESDLNKIIKKILSEQSNEVPIPKVSKLSMHEQAIKL